MSKRHILILVENLPIPFDRRVWQEAKTLQSHGYEISIICPKGRGYDASSEILEGVHIYRYAHFEAGTLLEYLLEYPLALLQMFYLACSVFARRRFHAIHACNPPDLLFLIGAFFKYFLGVRFIFDHHDLCPELFEAKFGKRFPYAAVVFLERLTFRLSDIVISTNNSYRQIAMERGNVPQERIFVLRSGPDLKRMKILPAIPELKYGKKILVAYLGVMGRQEGIHYLLEAIYHIVHTLQYHDIHFTLVGDGPEAEHLKAQAVRKNISAFINFTGRLSDEDMLHILNTADICVNPDEVNPMNDKSTMNKIMEYMALGKPIVQFYVVEGHVSAGESSLYARANDALDLAAKILELANNPIKRARMGAVGRARIENELAWTYEEPKLLLAYKTAFAISSLHQKIAWYFYRLRAMSPLEILFRIKEAILRKWDARNPPSIHETPQGLPECTALHEAALKWNIPAYLQGRFKEIQKQAETGKFFLLTKEWPAVKTPDKWHLDPVSSRHWPEDTFCFSINYRHNAFLGDVKYVWELNRLQYLQPLALLAFKTQDKQLADFVLTELESWIDHNPPYFGINWASGIELSLRLVSILMVTTLLKDLISEGLRARIAENTEAHALWLERYPSKFSSANNHRVAEALGILVSSLIMPETRKIVQRRNKGWKLLCAAAADSILQDGTGAEQAISYTAFTLEMLLLGAYIARASFLTIPKDYLQRLEKSAEHLRWFTDKNGNHPLIGDDDGARVIGVWDNHENYVNSVLSCAAAFLNRHDLVPPNNKEALRNMLFGFLSKSQFSVGVRNFHDGGYTVGRHDAQGREILLAFDHGPLGFSPLAAHGHADALSLWLHIDGVPVLVDAGTYLYHSDGKWRDYFRGTGAHNTLCIEKKNASETAGNFNWSHKARAKLLRMKLNEKEWLAEAEHDGYVKYFGCRHRRLVKVKPQKGCTVEDLLVGGQPHHVEISFLIHPMLQVEPHGTHMEIRDEEKTLLKISHEGSLQWGIEKAWHSPHFGEKIPAMRVVFSGILAPGEKAITLLDWG